MPYRLNIDRKTVKNLKKTNHKFREKISLTLLKIQENPFIGKSLKGWHEKLFTVRVWPFRIVYQLDQKSRVINVISIKHRKDVYRGLKNLQ